VNDINFNNTQIKINYQDTNISALEDSPMGIKFITPKAISGREGWYRMTIPRSDLTFGGNRYYKV
jgi:hypothetical protein